VSGSNNGLAVLLSQRRRKANDRLMMIRAALTERVILQKVLIPDSAHGTNPASAVICGYTVETVPSDPTASPILKNCAAMAKTSPR
jgi:glycine cleavage system protein P-like pyridoxal-binding family